MKPLGLGLALSILHAFAFAPATSAATAIDAEREIMASVNRVRTDQGLVPLRSDHRLWALADQRAVAMATAEMLSHEVAGSLAAGIDALGIQHYGYGEVIGYASGSTDAGATLVRLWDASPSHRALLMSSSFNYLGIGLARSSSGLTYGTIVLTESNDRTGARATIVGGSVSGNDVHWTWRGSDPPLQTHTAGLRDYSVQQRTDRGAWVTVASATRSTARSAANQARGHWYGLRIRARDRAGNVGPWSAERRIWVP